MRGYHSSGEKGKGKSKSKGKGFHHATGAAATLAAAEVAEVATAHRAGKSTAV